MEIVILIFSDNTWEKCLIKDINARIAEHKWQNEIVCRTVEVIFDYCTRRRVLEDIEEWQTRTNKYIADIEKGLETY